MFKIGDKVKFKKSSLDGGMIDATEGDVFEVAQSGPAHIQLRSVMTGWWNVSHFEHAKEEIMNNTEEQEIKWEVGQEVFCLLRGKGVVTEIRELGTYPIEVDFGETYDSYSSDGKLYVEHKNRSLFFSEPKIEAEKFPPKKVFIPVLKNGDVILAKDYRGFRVIQVSREDEHFVYNEDGTGFGKSGWEFRTLGEEIIFN